MTNPSRDESKGHDALLIYYIFNTYCPLQYYNIITFAEIDLQYIYDKVQPASLRLIILSLVRLPNQEIRFHSELKVHDISQREPKKEERCLKNVIS